MLLLAFVLENKHVHFDLCPRGVTPVPPFLALVPGGPCGTSWLAGWLACPKAEIPRGEGQKVCVLAQTRQPADPGSHRVSLAGTNYSRFKWPHGPPFAGSSAACLLMASVWGLSSTHTFLLLPCTISVPFLGVAYSRKVRGSDVLWNVSLCAAWTPWCLREV